MSATGTSETCDAVAAYNDMIHFYKNMSIAGGFLYVIAFGAGALSFDNGWAKATRVSA